MDANPWKILPLDRHSPSPLYQQLSEILVKRIKDGYFKPGDHLPSENELIGMYGVSRYVVRQTLNNLSRQGLIYTEHGRGSFVCPNRIDKSLDVLQSYHESMRKTGLPVEVKILTRELVYSPDPVAAALKLSPPRKAFHLERVGFVGDAPANVLSSYVAPGPWADEEKLYEFPGGSLYAYLATCGVRLARSHGYIEVIFADEKESRLLNVSRGSVLLSISSVVFEETGKPIEYTQVIYPGAMFRFEYDSYMSGNVAESHQQYMVFPTGRK